MEVTASVSGVAELVAELTGIAARSADAAPVLALVEADFRDVEARLFASGGEGMWPALAPATVAQKGHARPLVESGALRNSLTRRGAKYSRRRVRADEVIMGTAAPHAHLQVRESVPERPPVVVEADDERRWIAMVDDFVMTGALPLGIGL